MQPMMLTRTFLLAWYTAMMTRIDKAGQDVQKGFHDMHEKHDHTPVTSADLASSKIITQGWTQTEIISEETYAPPTKSLVTWVDPLDATQEYTEGLHEYNSIMACLTQDGQPKAGILHFPFRNETWAVIDGEWLERPAMAFHPPESVMVSRSHAGQVRKALNGFNVVPAGGSGYKAAEVLKGNALAYVHTTNIKTWDICALDAMFRAANGTFVEWNTGRPFNYTTNIHANGLFASTTFTREWFRIAVAVRSPWMQFLIVMVVWLAIYLYPQGSLSTPAKKKSTQRVSFLKCTAALLACYITWGIAQERIMSNEYNGQRFQYPAVLVFLNRLVASSFASYMVKDVTQPLFKFSVASMANIVASVCQYTALMYTIFPFVAIFKSAKVIVTMLVGRFVFKRKYTRQAYMIAFGIAIGVCTCLYSRYAHNQDAKLSIGVILLLAYVLFDALASQWQSYLFRTYSVPTIEMMYGVNTCSVLFTGVLVFLTGQLDASIDFARDHPEFIVHALALCLPAVIGQWFIFKTIEHHGAAAFSAVMTSRQAFSILASSVIFGHPFDAWTIVGTVIVLSMLVWKSRVSFEVKSDYNRVPQKDPEAGYDSIDEYELESDHED
ncbi:hypothetical protein N9A45_00135 [bacterium]|nr:hypothetical protein [bacterium]